MTVASQVDIALVDVILNDGLTGPVIGETLAELGVTVLFMTLIQCDWVSAFRERWGP